MSTDNGEETTIEETSTDPADLGISNAGPSFGAGIGDRPEVSASTIGRMMGLATVSELKLLEGKIDLMATKVNGMAARMDRISQNFSGLATGSDLERIDVQISALRSMLKDFLSGKSIEEQHPSEHGSTDVAAAKDFIRSNMTEEEKERSDEEKAAAAEAK